MERRSAKGANRRRRYTDVQKSHLYFASKCYADCSAQDAFEGIDELEDLRSDDEMVVKNTLESDEESLDRFEIDDQSSKDDSSSDNGDASSEVAFGVDGTVEQIALGDLVPVLEAAEERPKKRARGLASQGSSKRPRLSKAYHTRGKPFYSTITLLKIKLQLPLGTRSTSSGHRRQHVVRR